ncbi:sulfotransferase family 2 domain-containing protein [Candidatus Poribacteria bacterium]
MSSDPVILYLHIPKTGGTTLNTCIYDQWSADEDYRAEDGWLRSGIYYYPIGFLKDPNASVPSNIARALGREDIRAVLGHFCFGVHQFVKRPWTYITLLRNPVDRVLSLYYHLKTHEGLVVSIDDFVTNPPYREVDNDQTRRISGIEPEIGECSSFMLKKAKENLRKHFSVVGVTERFDEALILSKRAFGWSSVPRYFPQFVNKDRSSRASLSQKIIDAVIERNELDLQLYKFARDMLEEATSSQNPSFRDELESFRSSNAKYIAKWESNLKRFEKSV